MNRIVLLLALALSITALGLTQEEKLQAFEKYGSTEVICPGQNVFFACPFFYHEINRVSQTLGDWRDACLPGDKVTGFLNGVIPFSCEYNGRDWVKPGSMSLQTYNDIPICRITEFVLYRVERKQTHLTVKGQVIRR